MKHKDGPYCPVCSVKLQKMAEDLGRKPFDELKVVMFDNGDRSVGIEPTEVEITFEANVEFRKDLDYEDNRKLFRKQIEELACWFTDMPVQVYLEDECVDCGQITKKGAKHKCPINL